MKVLLLNGSPHAHGCTFTALSEVAEELRKNGIESEFFQIGTKPISGCIACNQCQKTGRCALPDNLANECAEKIRQCDGVVIGSPVYFASGNGSLIALLDRVFRLKGFANKPGACVVSCRRGGASATFDQINKYFGISSMPIVTSQYWNSVHGNTPDEVKQDLEGLQVMRTLARNMAWMLKCMEAGKEKGLVPPQAEQPPIATNFIR